MKLFSSWKFPAILLFGIGLSSIGSWIYFIALNLIVFQMTGSAMAVAALYIIRPFAAICTNFWGGSLVDRVNKKYVMVVLDVLQSLFLLLMVIFITNLPVIYCVVFVLTMIETLYSPASSSYITRLIPREQRQRFNALRSLLDSGAFLLGPAIAGILLTVGSPIFAIYINAGTFFISAIVTIVMPNVEKHLTKETTMERLTLKMLKHDWKEVVIFSRLYSFITLIYLLFGIFVVMQTAIDSLEVAFSKEVVGLTDYQYGVLVSIAGAGILIGAGVNVVMVSKLSIPFLMGIGSIMVSVGYILFAFSNTFLMASAGFFVLAFFNAFANTGYQTFYQNNIPVEQMGRIRSLYGLVEAVCIIFMTALIALLSHLVSVGVAVIFGSVVILFVTVMLLRLVRIKH